MIYLNTPTYQKRLEEIVGTIRAYGDQLLEGLTLDEITWRPERTRARTIQSYLRHIVNAEIYWLKTLGDEMFDYLSKNTSFNKIRDIYKKLEGHLTQLIANAKNTDLILRTPIFKENKLQQKGTLAWMVERTSLHAIHHFAQVAHIRYSLERPPEIKLIAWGKVMDSLILLKNSGLS